MLIEALLLKYQPQSKGDNLVVFGNVRLSVLFQLNRLTFDEGRRSNSSTMRKKWTDRQADKWTDRKMDRCYQVHYLLRFTVDKKRCIEANRIHMVVVKCPGQRSGQGGRVISPRCFNLIEGRSAEMQMSRKLDNPQEYFELKNQCV